MGHSRATEKRRRPLELSGRSEYENMFGLLKSVTMLLVSTPYGTNQRRFIALEAIDEMRTG
jgi:hypothetical protein